MLRLLSKSVQVAQARGALFFLGERRNSLHVNRPDQHRHVGQI